MNKSRTYHYHNLPVAYRQLGSGPPLLILHGWGSSGQIMMPLAEKMAEYRSCYVLDLPGFGDTPPPETSWAVDDYSDFIEAFIRDNNLEPVDLLAHSFGGRITLKLCARSNSKHFIGKVLITGGAGMKPRRSLSFYLKKYTAKTLKAPFLLLPSALREKALHRLRRTSLWKSLGSGDYSKLSGVMRETFVRTVTEYLEPCLPQISQEVLLLWGRNDEAAPLYQAERMEKGIEKAALVVIDHAGHYAFLDRPSHFLSIAKAFLEE